MYFNKDGLTRFKNLAILSFFCLLSSYTYAQEKTILGVIGDLNGTECQTEYPSNSLQNFQNLIKSGHLDHVVFVGDVVHGECLEPQGNSSKYPATVDKMWSLFDELFLKNLRSLGISFSLAPGNHDAPGYTGKHAFEVERKGFEKFWLNKPKNVGRVVMPKSPDKYPYYWAYTYKKNLYIMLQSTITQELTNKVEQKLWLKNILNSKTRKQSQKVIVAGHVPPYPVLSKSEKKYSAVLSNEQIGKKDGLMDILLDGNIDLLLVGHSHAPYPAIVTRSSDQKAIRILSMPCSHSPRKLFSQASRSPRGFAKVLLNNTTNIDIGIYNFEKSSALLPHSFFPKKIILNDSKLSYQLISENEYKNL